ncbi:Ldh family oxidoreductase [Paenibacillus sp. LMG 31456]|uniref:Ldh family oxidoreductase n=1 Tax=Paenibacillus foliorum TaxID=2654974 RepID=A0A972GLR0_9BACL|nr:Ldh family oxidoreductase [Paenibacillus foliorum]NOU92593.1 Ldh family oxidoreductase [Paenibacillus foliorum]
MAENSHRVVKTVLELYVHNIFQEAGLDKEQSATIARHLVLANLRGVDSHGVSRVDIYTSRLDSGIDGKKTEVKVEKESPSSMLIDGGNGLGIVLASKGIEIAVQKAQETGLAVVGIKNSGHCGMLADYTQYAAQNNCITIATTNAPSNMAPWGGKKGFFGTNPFSYGVPAGEEQDIIFDMATSVVARGKITLAHKNNQQIPLGWAISKEGKPTTDPGEALDGGLVLPVGGPKGYGLAFLVDILSGLLTGAAFGPYIGSLYKDLDRNQNVGQFFLAMRADLFEPLVEFTTRIDQMIREIRQIPLADGFDRIYLPGEIEYEKMAEREQNGIPLSVRVLEELKAVGNRYGIVSPF